MLDRGLSMSDSTSNAFQGDPRLQRFRDWMQVCSLERVICLFQIVNLVGCSLIS